MKLYGLASNNEGYTLACLKIAQNECSLKSIKQWNPHNKITRALLFHHGVSYAIPTMWRKNSSFVPIENSSEIIVNDSYTALTSADDFNNHKTILEDNLLGIFPSDNYLIEIPRYFSKENHDSFVTVAKNENFYHIGIIIDKKLAAVFRMAPVDDATLPYIIGRIERYWLIQDIGPFPSSVYMIGDFSEEIENIFNLKPIKINLNLKNDFSLATLESIGAALSIRDANSLKFTGETLRSSIRFYRTFLRMFSFLLIILCITSIGITKVTEYVVHSRYKTELGIYKKQTLEDKVVVDLINKTNDDASKYLTILKSFEHQTNWTQLLHILARAKNNKLLIDKIGCRQSDKGDGVELAITGILYEKSAIKKLIDELKSSKIISNIRLSTLYQKSESVQGESFKILCIMK